MFQTKGIHVVLARFMFLRWVYNLSGKIIIYFGAVKHVN